MARSYTQPNKKVGNLLLTLKVIDPQPFSEEEDRAQELGVTSMPLGATGEKLYLGLAATNSTDACPDSFARLITRRG